MDDTKQQIFAAALALADPFEWYEVIIDIEVEERGKNSEPYLVDSCVAVCFCRIDGEWCDHDLDLSAELRHLFHSLLRTDELPHATYRLLAWPDGSSSWDVNSGLPHRLHGKTQSEIDTIIESKLNALVNDAGP